MTRASEMCPVCHGEEGYCECAAMDAVLVAREREALRNKPDGFKAALVIACVGAWAAFFVACAVYVAVNGVPV